MFGIGMPELIIILLIAVMLFGASRLPQIGEGLGKAIKGFRKSVSEPDPVEGSPPSEDSSKSEDKDKPS